jgi:xanthosine utilization system XapX-like protein
MRQDARMSAALPSGLRNWKSVVRRSPGGSSAVKVIVFFAGLLFILMGLALAALPGPLTIPPILVGVYIWSTEFPWAERLLDRAKRSAREAWDKAKQKPVTTAAVTLSGVFAFGFGVWLASRYGLIDWAKQLLGLG